MNQAGATSSIRAIATRAGLSPTTVSAILRGSRSGAKTVRYSVETARRVAAIAAELDYVPNRLTQSLIRRESFALGVLAPWPRHERYNALVGELARLCQTTDHHLIVAPCSFDHREIMARLRALTALQVRAVVMIPCGSLHVEPEIVMREHREKLALCPGLFCVDWFRDELIFDCVEADERLMVALPLRHLAQQGHRRIAYIGIGSARRRAYLREALDELGLMATLDLAQASFQPDRNLAVEDIPDLTRRVLNRSPRPTALFCWQDRYAAQAYRVCEQEYGLRVGRDIALIGQDDTTLATSLPVPLTSLSHRDADFAAVLYGLIQARLAGHLPPGPQQRLLEPHLVVRASTAFTL